MGPLLPIVALGALAVYFMGGKQAGAQVAAGTQPAAGAKPVQLTWDETVNRAYTDAMQSTDLTFIGKQAQWFQAYSNRPDLYAQVSQHWQDVYKAQASKAAETQAAVSSGTAVPFTTGQA